MVQTLLTKSNLVPGLYSRILPAVGYSRSSIKPINDSVIYTTSTIVLLPLADSRYQRQQLWIRNLKDFDRLAPDWTNLKTYLDPNFGNPYILNKADKTGSKTYKSRMRFGFDDDR